MNQTYIFFDVGHKKKIKELNKIEKEIIKYLLNLKGKRLFIEKMAKDVKISKQTIYKKLEKLLKEKIMNGSWRLNPFALGYKVVQTEVLVKEKNKKNIMEKLKKHPAVISIKLCFKDNYLIDFVVRDLDDFKVMEEEYKNLGIDFLQMKIIIENIYEA